MLISVQALRAFAAWVVVFHHFVQVFFDFDTNNTFEHLLATRGQMGVDIFFIISGFVIYAATARRAPSSGEFLLQRAARIVPAYWLYTAITAGIIYLSQDVMPDYELDLKSLVMSLFFLPTENPAGYGYYPTLPVGWTLNFEMLFYLVFAGSLLVNRHLRLWLLALVLIALSAWLAERPLLSDFYHDPIIYNFLLGLGVGILYRHNWLPQARWLPASIAVGAFTLLMQFDDPQGMTRFLAWGLPSAVLLSAFISMEPLFAGNRVIKALGDWSYSTYLLHVIVLWTAQYTLREHVGLPPYATLAICLPLIAVLSWASFEFIEKRLSRRLRQWVLQRRSSPAASIYSV
ncbi:acyltransferase family protein [Chromohalobacter canadensis]|uniref:Acyltransferase n=1 Tax=Chromohalobacter canadensis TaxID=141389 RepID=A0ABZ0Y6H8_9GAMM|nr:acyltransferase [Chromohalobacter canadensis]MCK0769654.1 acyltransferase [Chromohalobacter canadensis]WQH07662.1 acyltransferase [Chromohalobacter canadensis]